MIKGILYKYLLKALVIALLGLILFGVVPGLSTLLVLFVGLRFTYLAAEAVRKPLTSQQREAILDRWTRHYEKIQSQRLSIHNNPLKLSARQLAEKPVNRVVQSYVPPRPKRELAAEALGVMAFAVLIPLVIALYTRDFFSLRTPQGWAGAGVVVLCLGVYAWPYRRLKSPKLSDVRILWWVIPFAVAFPLLTHAIHTRHPYLDPFNPDRDRLAAERVLALKNNVVAGHHADWVLRYARQLDQRGDSPAAIRFYREGLRLDANDLKAYARLAALESPSATNLMEAVANSEAAARAPYWTDAQPIIPSPRGQIDSQLENVADCTVVIVPVGKVSDELLDTIGHVIHHELDLPVLISTNVVPVPPHTRVRGLATGPQWDHGALVRVFTNATSYFPHAPIRYLLVTSVDIYIEDANYVVSASYPWGAVLSSFRYEMMGGGESLLRQRTAKQGLCAVLKSFNLQASPDRNDVTSYARSPEEFDAKGNRPDAETLKMFHEAVASVNDGWQKFLAMRRKEAAP
jgi:predicted Zn-dependent protease